MRNENSTSGIGEDLLRTIVQLASAELHAKTLMEKARAELENGLVDLSDTDVLNNQIEKVKQFTEDINEYAQLRRRTMLKLFSMFEDGDKDMWCQIKHLGSAMMTAFEAYEASDDDVELADLAYDINKEFIKATSRFLGTEITDCASCFSDFLKAERG